MSGEDITIMERLAVASGSSDLSEDAERLRHADCLKGLAIAGIRHPKGYALVSLDLTRKPEKLPEAMEDAMRLVRRIGQREGWVMHAGKQKRVAEQALLHYFNPVCPACGGRKATGVERKIIWTEVPCETCRKPGSALPESSGAGPRRAITPSGFVPAEKGIATACPDCHGKGMVKKRDLAPIERINTCLECDGSGRMPLPSHLKREISCVLAEMQSARFTLLRTVRKVLRVGGEVG